METQKKSVPDVECLKYHGTPGKPDIKIFVSHRIDLDSETIDNPLYIPVRCGAVYDERQGVTMLGDDTGDNISEKRNSFCELTVQYWAWKNIDADYYGMCQYRRYLSFSEDEYPMDASYVHERYITKDVISRHKLLESVMRTEIEKYDVLFAVPTDILRTVGAPESNYDLYKIRPQDFDGTKPVDLLISIIQEKYPEYAPDAENYFSASTSTFYNCYVMKKEIFHDYNQWLFDILFEFEQRLETSGYSSRKLRAPAFMSEPLFGIYFMHQQRVKEIKAGTPHQIIFFEHPEKIADIKPAFASSNVPVAIPSSNYYAPYLAVCLKSILCHISESHNYDFIILSTDISEQNRRILKGLAYGYKNVSIRFYNPEPLVYEYKKRLYVAPSLNLITFYRIAIPFFLKDYDKVICIDSDLVFERDIADLYETPLGETLLAAVQDAVWQGFIRDPNSSMGSYLKEKYHLKYPDGYVNTGVGIYNLFAWRKAYSLNDVLVVSSRQKYRIQEQDVINLLAEGRITFLDGNWNVYTCDALGVKNALEYAPCDDKRKYLLSREEPFVIHWANEFKPWKRPDCDFADRFWFYARISPLYECILHRMMLDVRRYIPPVPPPPYRSKARKFADKLLPKGTRRRSLAKKILPKGSRRWNFLKKIYWKIFKE